MDAGLVLDGKADGVPLADVRLSIDEQALAERAGMSGDPAGLIDGRVRTVAGECRIGVHRGRVQAHVTPQGEGLILDVPLRCVAHAHPDSRFRWVRMTVDMSGLKGAMVRDLSPREVRSRQPVRITTTYRGGSSYDLAVTPISAEHSIGHLPGQEVYYPTIKGSGESFTWATWDFEALDDAPLHVDRELRLLIELPSGGERVDARVTIRADIAISGVLSRVPLVGRRRASFSSDDVLGGHLPGTTSAIPDAPGGAGGPASVSPDAGYEAQDALEGRRQLLPTDGVPGRGREEPGRSAARAGTRVADGRASTPPEPAPSADVQRVVVVLADEWFPARGGLSTVNRHLCAALAAAGTQIYCVVPEASREELVDAQAMGVHVLPTERVPGTRPIDALMRRPPLPAGILPDVIVGHTRITGPAALVLAKEHFPSAARVHVVHMIPDEIEWLKPDRGDDAGIRAEDRTWVEFELARDAACVAAVGPRLHHWLARELSAFASAPALVQLDPGFDAVDRGDRDPPPGMPQILLVGRLEDAQIKGLDIAAKAVGRVAEMLGSDEMQPELLLRGSPAGEAARLRDAIREWLGRRSLRVTVRNYSTADERIRHERGGTTLVLMPSRAEAFGMVGLEAITAGIPVLVSNRSGLGMLLRDSLTRDMADRLVVPVEDDESGDVARWSEGIAAVLRDRPAAFRYAAAVRRAMAAKHTWAAAAEMVLSAIRTPTTI